MSDPQPEPQVVPPRRVSRLLDLRFVIAVMFAIFGVLVTGSGFTVSNQEIQQAAGINISLWTGLGMLALSAGFGLWVALSPPDVPEGHIVDSSDR